MQTTSSRPAYSFEYLGDRFRVVIPIPKAPEAIVLLSLGLIAWIGGAIFASVALITDHDGCLLIWLLGWLYGGILNAFIFLRILTGKEIFEISKKSIVWRYQILGLSIPKEFFAENIRAIRISAQSSQPYWYFGSRRLNWWSFDNGTIAFDYGAGTAIRIGNGLDGADAEKILAAMQQMFPEYHYGSNMA
jgi:hypothetical protein